MGGPLPLLEREFLSPWHRSFSNSTTMTDYDRACKIADYVGAIELGSGVGVVLGEEPFQRLGDDPRNSGIVLSSDGFTPKMTLKFGRC
jgi:hypothetical protein